MKRRTGKVVRIEPTYNPLDKHNLGVSVADALLARAVEPLPDLEPFIGAGIYALYYTGDHPAYSRITLANRDNQFTQPIYVGKAVPEGARKGQFGLGASPGTVLFDRIRQHVRSIEQARNLELTHFSCRYLAVDDIWIPLGETLLIERFRPVWNKVVEGFGIHDPGSGRVNQQRSVWDALHPGRLFADRLPPNKRTEHEILAQIAMFLGASESTIP